MISSELKRVMELQKFYSKNNTSEMQERGTLVRRTIPSAIEESLRARLGDNDWHVEGRDGTGLKTSVPWIRLFIRDYSPNARMGFYLVFLFSTDGERLYLTLNQGTTDWVNGSFRPKEKREVAEARDWAHTVIIADSRLAPQFERKIREMGLIDLGNPSPMAESYIPGDVCHIEYNLGDFPSDEQIIGDIQTLMKPLELIYKSSQDSLKPEFKRTSGTLDLLQQRTHWHLKDLNDLVESLIDQSPQVVLAGPPGTGKTFVARQVAAHVLGTPGDVQNPAISIVQFHPSYGYEQFIEGLQPVSNESGNFDFQNVAGEIVRLVEKIEEDGLPRVLIIDEMNRANLPRVFGELMYLLEYRDSEINLMHREAFSLPRELYIIGTMNTADRSTRSIDIALRRRFDFFEVFPDVSILRAHYESGQNSNSVGEELYSGFEELNRRLTERLSKHFTVGHSYFMQKEFSAQDLRRVWKHQVFPLIEEYFFSSPTELDNFPIKDFFPSV